MAYDKLFFDLQKELTTNPAFVTRCERIMALLRKAAAEGNRAGVSEEMHRLLRLCDYNPTLLVPIFFPHFPEEAPMTLLTRPHAISMMSFIPGGSLTVEASRQIGKCLAASTKVTVRDSAEGDGMQVSMEELFSDAKSEVNSPVLAQHH